MNYEYRKKPIVIEAFQMTEQRGSDNSEWPNWLHEAWNLDKHNAGSLFIVNPEPRELGIHTLEGYMAVAWNDYIIRGVQGELYPCKPDIFAASYEQASASMQGVALIAVERARQVNEEGWTAEHDSQHDDGELALAALCYAAPPDRWLRDVDVDRDGLPYPPGFWPWDQDWWKPTPDDRVRELVKAGVLIAAEIDRLQRAVPA